MLLMLERYFLWFILYSAIGWIYESILCSIKERKAVNRGFFHGPYCPIYGWGAILNIIFLGKIKNLILLFFLSVLLTCTLEYVTSYVMEKMFNARWWDYSYQKFNIKGRVCLISGVVFGICSVMLIKIAHPFVAEYTQYIPQAWIHGLVAFLCVIFTVDNIITFRSLIASAKMKAVVKTYKVKN